MLDQSYAIFDAALDADVLRFASAAPRRINGGPAADRINGTAKADFITGGAGNDVLKGGAGDDIIEGEAGNDRLFSGAGNDILRGGPGDDTLVLTNANGKDKVNLETDVLILANAGRGGTDVATVANFTWNGHGQRSGHVVVENEDQWDVFHLTDERAYLTNRATGQDMRIYWDGGAKATEADIFDVWLIG